jgi:hypothetical protein
MTSPDPTPPASPRDGPRTLARFGRGDSDELRVSLAQYKCHQYVLMQIWSLGPDLRWRPRAGRSATVRVRELRRLAEVLMRAADQVEGRGP